MGHNISFNSELHITEIKFQGSINLLEIEELLSEAVKVAKEHNSFLFLSDYTEASLNLSTMELYELPKMLADIFASSGIPPYKLKRALVVLQDLKKDFRFFEAVSANNGQKAKLFQNLVEAKKWLLDQ